MVAPSPRAPKVRSFMAKVLQKLIFPKAKLRSGMRHVCGPLRGVENVACHVPSRVAAVGAWLLVRPLCAALEFFAAMPDAAPLHENIRRWQRLGVAVHSMRCGAMQCDVMRCGTACSWRTCQVAPRSGAMPSCGPNVSTNLTLPAERAAGSEWPNPSGRHAVAPAGRRSAANAQHRQQAMLSAAPRDAGARRAAYAHHSIRRAQDNMQHATASRPHATDVRCTAPICPCACAYYSKKVCDRTLARADQALATGRSAKAHLDDAAAMTMSAASARPTPPPAATRSEPGRGR